MKDWRGIKIEVGDTVVYPTRVGGTQQITEAVVEEVDDAFTPRPTKSNQTPQPRARLRLRRQREAARFGVQVCRRYGWERAISSIPEPPGLVVVVEKASRQGGPDPEGELV